MSISNIFNGIMFKFLTAVFSLIIAIPSLSAGINKELPEEPENFTPVMRFAVVSDIHIDDADESKPNAVHFKDFFTDVYDYSESKEYNKLDAIFVTGDMTGRGLDDQYTAFNKISNENIHKETQLICMLGNHEFIAYRDDDPTVAYVKYKQFINNDVDRHDIINGYHFISVSYSDDAHSFKTKKEWLKNELDKASKDTPDKPIFVFNHPHPFATVYGSINWSDLTLRNILSKYPNVVDFSGHSHYAANDPRSIWQESFTAIGAGCLASQQTNLDYLTGGKDAAGESGVFWIVELDKNGNICLKLYDVVNHKLFDDVSYYITDIGNMSARRYTWTNMKSLDTAPQFPDNSEISFDVSIDGDIILKYPDATGYFAAESYKINIKKGLNSIWSGSVDSNYVRAIRNGVSTNIGHLEPGTYNVTIIPVSPYSKSGNPLSSDIEIKN